MEDFEHVHYIIMFSFCCEYKAWIGYASKTSPDESQNEICYQTEVYRCYFDAVNDMWSWLERNDEFVAALANGLMRPSVQ